MEELKHRNDIEIKLLANRRFIYSNRRSNIVITAENRATDIVVVFPDEYAEYSKRVDFVNSQGKEWTEGLYCPEYEERGCKGNKPRKPNGGGHNGNNYGSGSGENPCRFHFQLPSEVTTTGELKMQFLAYKPDESMTTVPFEIITIDVQEGVLAFKRNAKSNPDLLILSYNRSTQALFNSEQAKAKSEAAANTSNEAKEIAENAVTVSQKAVDTADNAVAIGEQNAADLATERAVRQAAIESEQLTRTAEISRLDANLDAERDARIQADTAEAILRAQNDDTESAARIQADAELDTKVTAEVARATAAETQIAADLAAEIERAEAQESAGLSAVQREADRAKTAEDLLVQSIAAEAQARQSADALEVQNRTAAIEAEATARTDADATEQAARIAGDSQNAQNLAAEVTRATATEQAETVRATQAESDLQAAINEEKSRAISAENLLTLKLTAESERAALAEQTNAAAVVAERTRALTAESNLQNNLTAEAARAQSAELSLSSSLVTETGRATVAEAGLASAINSEQVRAATQETLLGSAIQNETLRAQDVEASLRDSLNGAIGNAVGQANAYTDEVVEQVRTDGTVYRGTVKEGELPANTCENGDLYWISDFNITQAGHAGSAIWNGKTAAWDFSIDRYKHEDNDTIVPRESDGALKVADVSEGDLTPDEADFTETVQSGFKAFLRTIIRKVKGLFLKTVENEAAITAEFTRAQTVESGLFTDIATEAARAGIAEQNLTDNLLAEVSRATTAESNLSANITAENARATAAENGLSNEIAAEIARAQSAEGQLLSGISAETTRANTAETSLAENIAAETTRAVTAEAIKVDKVTGKGLSTEDYTSTDKQKLAGIQSGAQVNEIAEAPADGKQYARKNAAWSEVEAASGGGSGDSSDKLPLAGGTLTGDITLKYPAKLIGSGNGKQDADWLKYDNGTNFLTIGNTETVPEIASAAPFFCRKDSAGTRYKIYDEGNPPVTEIPLTFSDINAGITNLSGHYVRESAEHGRLLIRLYVSTSIASWTTLFKITNAEIPRNVGSRLGFCTTMSETGFNGSSLISVRLNSTNDIGVMCGLQISATWNYTMTISV